MNSTVVGLDIGTTKVTAVVGEMIDEYHTRVIGVGITPSQGMEKGLVVNVEQTTRCIQQAIDEAQRMADLAIGYVYIGIAGGHIQSSNQIARIDLKGATCITRHDVERLIEEAKGFYLPGDKEIIHAIPREFSLDSEPEIKDPVGMVGTTLEGSIHVVTGAVSAIRNMVQCAHNVNLDVADVILQPLASAEAVLTDDERKMGVILVDIGGGTTDLAIFQKGKLTHSAVIPVGGGHFTNDLAHYLKCPYSEAEKLKIRYGSVLEDLVDSELKIEVDTLGGEGRRTVPLKTIVEVLNYRGDELVELCLAEVREHVPNLNSFAAGIVVTGGGAQIRGIDGIFQAQSNLGVRLGKIRNVTGLVEKVSSPIFATAVGLIFYGYKNHELVLQEYHEEGVMERLVAVVKSWFL
ncbi:MAG: cell division protein FtsA [bacterium]|nr:cell division protein FtsA [bacterium]